MGTTASMKLALYAAVLALCSASASAETVLVTGATGRTGSLAYLQLKAAGFDVKALVMNSTRAAAVLHCGACTEKEGIFVGDVTKPESLVPAMHNVTRIVIASASTPTCGIRELGCKFPKGGSPKEVDWLGNKNVIMAGIKAGAEHVVMISSMETTMPDTFLDKLGHGWLLFYKLNAEAFLMNSGLKYTIIKPGGLTTDAGGKALFVGHEDQGFNGTSSNEIARADVATVITEACKTPSLSTNTRFDLVADPKKAGTGDFKAFFAAAKQVV